ncbi:MAG: TrmH family RNA methyltransferase [Patescibacteria group bacterium]
MARKKNNLKSEIVAVLCDIRSIHNVGSIFRTADGACVSKIYLCGITPSPVDRIGNYIRQFSKVSLGAERHLEWEKAKSALRVVKKLKAEGFKILAIEQAKNSIFYYKAKMRGGASKIALVVGSEIGGVPQAVLKLTNEILEIPMRGAIVRHARHPRRTGSGKESLNVSVAFGIVAYELNR